MTDKTPQVGELAPDFEAKDAKGNTIHLASYRGQKNIVLYFYPRDFSPVCTKEACGFRDMYEELQTKDTEVIGVSTDDEGSHQGFALKHALPFPLISDPEKHIAARYGASSSLFGLLDMTKRLTFVIDKAGKIAAVLSSAVRAGAHLDGVKDALARLP